MKNDNGHSNVPISTQNSKKANNQAPTVAKGLSYFCCRVSFYLEIDISVYNKDLIINVDINFRTRMLELKHARTCRYPGYTRVRTKFQGPYIFLYNALIWKDFLLLSHCQKKRRKHDWNLVSI